MNIDNQTTELEGLLQLSSEGSKTFLTASLVHKSGQKTLYEWGFNAACQRNGAYFNVGFNIMRDAQAVQDYRKMCLNVNLDIPAAPANKYLIEASKPLTADISMNWAAEGGDLVCGGEPAKKLPFNVRIIAETTREQEQMAAAANVWPFDSCKKDNNTLACRYAANEMATLRKYSLLLNHSQPLPPEMFDLMSFARTRDGSLLISVEVSRINPIVYLTLGSETSRFDITNYWLNPVLVNTQYPVLNKVAMLLGHTKF